MIAVIAVCSLIVATWFSMWYVWDSKIKNKYKFHVGEMFVLYVFVFVLVAIVCSAVAVLSYFVGLALHLW
jgi:hypothetical protein